MSAWGYGPFDNDGAIDWASDLRASKALVKDIRDALKIKQGHDEVRAAAYLIPVAYKANILGPSQLEPLIPDVTEALNKLLDDSSWISGWKNSGAVRRSIRNQINKLEAIQKDL